MDAPFQLRFIDGNNSIRIAAHVDPVFDRSYAVCTFAYGENTLIGVPSNYSMYKIIYVGPAQPTVANIETILQWHNMVSLTIFDEHNFVVMQFLERIEELSKLTKLEQLIFTLQPSACEQIHVATFLDTLPKLKMIEFQTIGWNDKQREAFQKRNQQPWNWDVGHGIYATVYRKIITVTV